jgi:glycosyltransferase involved in cell wall biosynthesis
MGLMPSISVILLAYNRPQLLAEALAGVAAQSRPPDEVLVIDDHSEPPLTARGARLIRQPVNRGPSAAAARGIVEARGDAIAFLNDDDLWAPGLLAGLEAGLEANPDACMAFCDHGVIDADGMDRPDLAEQVSARYRRTRLADGPIDLRRAALVDQSVPAASFALTRREALSPTLVRAGGEAWDYFVAVGAALTGRPGVYVNRRLGWYRLSSNGVSAGWGAPERAIAVRARRVAAARLALASPAAGGVRGPVARNAARDGASALKAALHRPRPGDSWLPVLMYYSRELTRAVVSPRRAPPR